MNSKHLNVDSALLVLRVGLGGMMLTLGIPKLLKGPDLWPRLGSKIQLLGIDFAHTFFGAAAVGAETIGALLVMIGLKTRPAAMSVVFTMLVAAMMHHDKADSWSKVSHPIEVGIGFLAIVIAGAGRYAVEKD